MEDRIRKFMEYKGISPSELADTIGVQRSNVTHVLKARNKPSFQFIEKMLQIYPDLNAKWLMLGEGNMVDVPIKSKTLFDQLTEEKPKSVIIEDKKEQEPKTIIKNSGIIETKDSVAKPIVEEKPNTDQFNDQLFPSEKPIERLIVFYNDQTFKVYNPSR